MLNRDENSSEIWQARHYSFGSRSNTDQRASFVSEVKRFKVYLQHRIEEKINLTSNLDERRFLGLYIDRLSSPERSEGDKLPRLPV